MSSLEDTKMRLSINYIVSWVSFYRFVGASILVVPSSNGIAANSSTSERCILATQINSTQKKIKKKQITLLLTDGYILVIKVLLIRIIF